MTRTVKAPEVRKDELLDVALGLFAERGYHDTSVQAITDAAGVAKGLFYHYFESKDDLLDALASREGDRLFEAVRAKSREIEGVPLQELSILIGMIASSKLEGQPELTAALMHSVYRDGNSALRDRLTQRYDDLLKPLVVELIEEGNALGEMHVDDPDATTEVLLAMWTGLRARQMALVMGLREHPEFGDVLLVRLEAVERATERILGAATGTLCLFDRDRWRTQLIDLADTQAEPPA